jgi:hypothetical protein
VAPNYTFRINPTLDMIINYQHANYHIEQNERTRELQNRPRLEQKISIALDKAINSTNRFSIIFQKQDTDFDDDSRIDFSDYIQDSAFIRWSMNNRANQLNFEVGRYKVVDIQNRSIDQDQWSLIYNRIINRNQTINFQFFKRLSSLFIINPITGEISINQQNSAVDRAEESKGTGLLYNFNNQYVNLNIAYFKNELTGLFNPTFELRKTASTRLQYNLRDSSAVWRDDRIILFLSQSKREFSNPLSSSIGTNVSRLSISYQFMFSPRTSLSLSYETSNNEQFFIQDPQQSFERQSIILRFEYFERSEF